MATFAMICKNQVIEVLYDLEVAPVWPPDAAGNPVMSVECPAEATREWNYDPDTGRVTEPVPVIDEDSDEDAPSREERQESRLAYLVMKMKGM